MIRLTRPSKTAAEHFDKCIESTTGERLGRIKSLRTQVLEQAKVFEENAAEFRNAKPQATTTTTTTSTSSSQVKKDMIWLYDKKLSDTSSPARYLYEAILALTKVCPYCEKIETETLDHHLSKSLYPLLSVAPLNLVPSCYKCNLNKYNRTKDSHVEEPIHPYFDDPDVQIWLVANVVRCPPVRIRFSISPPSEWTEAFAKRMSQQYEVLDLGSRFESRIDQFLTQTNHYHQQLLKSAGRQVFREHLEAMEASERKARQNSWIAATYRALASSESFLSGEGFT